MAKRAAKAKKAAGAKNAPVPTLASEKDWRAQDDARTIERYAELCADKERHGAAKKLLRQKVKQLVKLDDVDIGSASY